MGLLNPLGFRIGRTVLDDPAFGRLVFIDGPKPYWEGDWLFPFTGTRIAIGLTGSVEGPNESARAFYLALPDRFDSIVTTVRPILDGVFRELLDRPLDDMWRDVKLAAIAVEDPDAVPILWDVAFETLGKKWLGIAIPFVDHEPQDPVIDT